MDRDYTKEQGSLTELFLDSLRNTTELLVVSKATRRKWCEFAPRTFGTSVGPEVLLCPKYVLLVQLLIKTNFHLFRVC